MPNTLQSAFKEQRIGPRRTGIKVPSGYSILAATRQAELAISIHGLSALEKRVVDLAARELRCFCAEVASNEHAAEPADRAGGSPLCTPKAERRFLAMTLVIWRQAQPPGARSPEQDAAENLPHSVGKIVQEVLSWLVSPLHILR